MSIFSIILHTSWTKMLRLSMNIHETLAIALCQGARHIIYTKLFQVCKRWLRNLHKCTFYKKASCISQPNHIEQKEVACDNPPGFLWMCMLKVSQCTWTSLPFPCAEGSGFIWSSRWKGKRWQRWQHCHPSTLNSEKSNPSAGHNCARMESPSSPAMITDTLSHWEWHIYRKGGNALRVCAVAHTSWQQLSHCWNWYTHNTSETKTHKHHTSLSTRTFSQQHRGWQCLGSLCGGICKCPFVVPVLVWCSSLEQL